MTKVSLDQPVPEIRLPATDQQELSLTDFKGQKVVVYFYPKNNTPGCTQEGQDFRDHYPEFKSENTIIFGVSRDGIKSHDNFRNKHGFPFHLLSDKDETLCQAFGVIKLKKLYGKEHLGIERSTFLIDEAGVLRREWRGVKVPGHVDEVLAAVKEL